jgi:von Willebrand factor type A domain-containing protein
MRSIASRCSPDISCVDSSDRWAVASTRPRRTLRRCAFIGVSVAVFLACGSGDDEQETRIAPLGNGQASAGSGGQPVTGPSDPGNPANPGNGGAGSGLIGLVDDEGRTEPACVDQFAELAERPPIIEFVVDTSGSMSWVAGTEREPEAGELSKWEITSEALVTAIAAMPDAAAVGISYYPNTTGGGAACFEPDAAAPIARLTAEHRALVERVNQNRTPEGGTPTHAAYEFGVQQLQESNLQGSKFLVLLTDGIPTYTLECGGDGRTRVDAAPLVASVDERYQQDAIRTFVIGSPGSEEAREELSKMAFVGGTGPAGCEDVLGTCHFDMTGEPDFSSALRGALGDITEATSGCNYAVPEPPRGRTRINLDDVSVVVESGGTQIREFSRSGSAECDAGWQYSSDRSTIVLCRATCDELSRLADENPDVAVRVRFGCSLTPS